MKKLSFIVAAALFVSCSSTKINKSKLPSDMQPKAVMNIMNKVASWQLHKIEDKKVSGDWTIATLYAGFYDYAKLSGNKTYLDYLNKVGNALDWNTGRRRFMADDYCIGQTYALMYSTYKEPKMIAKFRGLADTIAAQPHTESLEMKGSIVNREWSWCDALFMAPPALAYLSTVTNDPKYLETADKLWWKTTEYLFDKSEDLYFRDSRYFNKKEKNGQKMFWSRGNGWVMGGLVRMIDNMPKNYKNRTAFVELYKKMAKRIAGLQTADGTWHASLLDPESYPVKETSGTGFYCYALAWGIRHGYLSASEYMPVVEKAWKALVSCVHPDGKLGFVQQIGERPEDVNYESTQVYGVGAFLLAGSELYQMGTGKDINILK